MMSKGGSSSGVGKSESCDRLEKRQMSRNDGENNHSKLKRNLPASHSFTLGTRGVDSSPARTTLPSYRSLWNSLQLDIVGSLRASASTPAIESSLLLPPLELPRLKPAHHSPARSIRHIAPDAHQVGYAARAVPATPVSHATYDRPGHTSSASRPITTQATRTPAQSRAGHPYAQPYSILRSPLQPDAGPVNKAGPDAQAGPVRSPRKKLRRCTEHAGKANSISQSIVSTCAECTIYRNVNTYINLEPRAHSGNGNGGNDETQARLITERKAFLAALEDPVVALPKILDVIGPAQYDILMETYHGRGGSNYQPPATYLLGL